MLAAARAPKTKEKKPPATERQPEPPKKRTSREQKTNTKPDAGRSEPKPQRNRAKSRPKQGRSPRTANRGPDHSKGAVGINGSAPVIGASNGHEVPAVAATVVDEEEEDDLSPVDMSQVSECGNCWRAMTQCSCGQAGHYEANIPQSKLLAGEGNRAAKAGEFQEAVLKYSEAITLYPFDHRFIHTPRSGQPPTVAIYRVHTQILWKPLILLRLSPRLCQVGPSPSPPLPLSFPLFESLLTLFCPVSGKGLWPTPTRL